MPAVSSGPVTLSEHIFLGIWEDAASRRKFFENFAKAHKFDPLIAENWYLHSMAKMKESHKGTFQVINYHGRSVAQALLDLFPDIGLQKSRFGRKWADRSRRRKFFENYAKDQKFDPLHAENWYSQTAAKVKSVNKQVRGVLHYHRGSLSRALLDLFPGIGLEQSKFRMKKTLQSS